jgi:hypothetical protein
MIARLEASGVEHERMTLVGALAPSASGRFWKKRWPMPLKKSPDRIRFMTLAAAAANRLRRIACGPGLKINFERTGSMHPLLFERVVAAFVPGPGLQDPDRTRAYCKLLQTTPA